MIAGESLCDGPVPVVPSAGSAGRGRDGTRREPLPLVPRPRLEEALYEGLATTRITLLTAPAGSGKSVAMAQLKLLCEARGDRVVWHTASKRDDDPAALEALVADVSGAQDAEATTQARAAGGRRTILFLDDADAAFIATLEPFIAGLIGRRDGLIHPVVACRTRLPLELAALRLQGLVDDCDAAALAFTELETIDLLGLRPGRLNEARVRQILRHTEGWATALQVIRRQIAGGADLASVAEAFTGADSDVRDYLDEAVFRDLGPGLRSFLQQIAGLGRISPELAATVTGSPDATRYYREIIDRNLFWAPLDRQGNWIRLHRVFRDFLRAGDGGDSPEQSTRRFARAALWHERHGNWIEAVNYALASGDSSRAARWLRDCGAEMLTTRGETVAFLECCEKLPEPALRDPELVIWMVWAAVFSASSFVAARLMTRHVATLEAARHASDRVQLIRILLAFFSYDFKTAIVLGASWMKVPGHGNAFDRATVAAMMAMALRTQLRQVEALGWLATARRELAPVPSPYGSAWIETIEAYLALGQGRAAWACEVLERLLAELPAAALIRGTVELLLADAYYECGRLVEAGDLVARSLATLEHHGVADFAYCGWRTAALVALEDRGPREALTLLREGEPIAARRYGNREVLMLRLLQGELLASLTEEARGSLVAQGITAPPLDGVPGDWCPELSERRKLLGARLNVIGGNPRQALKELQSVLAGARTEGRLRVWADASCIKAAALFADGDSQQALRTVVDCLQKVARLGVNRTVVDNAVLLRPLGALLASYRASGGDADDRQVSGLLDDLLRVMDIRVQGCGEPDDSLSSPVALTAKERLILIRVAEGLTNAEICERLVLALPTVRWHLHNIFGKLEVSNRTAAVNKARLFGLLD